MQYLPRGIPDQEFAGPGKVTVLRGCEVDSGVEPQHPFVQAAMGGPGVPSEGQDQGFTDCPPFACF